MTGYTSFLIRHWQQGDGERRITIEYIQGGLTHTSSTMAQALSWIDQQLAVGTAGEPPQDEDPQAGASPAEGKAP